LGSQWCSGAARGPSGDAVRSILGLPDYLRPYDMMAVGYPAGAPLPKELRDLDDVIHYDACGPGDLRNMDEMAPGTSAASWTGASEPTEPYPDRPPAPPRHRRTHRHRHRGREEAPPVRRRERGACMNALSAAAATWCAGDDPP
jgi:nitroreductase